MKILSLHIPKCGGKTLETIWIRNAGRSYFFFPFDPFMDINNINRLKECENDVHIVHGHFLYGLHEHLKGDWQYVTFMREPRERVISQYFYILNKPNHYLHEKVKGMSFEEYLEGNLSTELSNGQVKFLCGSLSPENMEAALEAAKKNLDEFYCVGITEYFDESLLMIKQRTGIRKAVYSLQNVGKKEKLGLSKAQEEKIREMNHYDYELYSHAQAKFEKQRGEYEGNLERDLKKLRKRNSFMKKLSKFFPGR